MARDLSRSRAILIGNGTFTDRERLPAVPARGCVAAMRDLLTSELCGWPPDRIELFEDVAAPSDLASKLVRSLRGTDGMLVVYYAGHGMLTMAGDLALALKDTEVDPEALPYTAMPYGSLAKIMGYSPAATKLVILDCCYAETANQANFGTQSAGMSDVPPVDGLYFIGASKRLEKAQFPLNGDLTYFTEAFIDIVRAGIAGQPPAPELTLGDIFRALRARLVADGLPEPADSGIRDARQYPFAVNAVTLAAAAGGLAADPARTARLRILDQAEHAAAEIRGKSGQALALLAVAAAMTTDDPARAMRLGSRAVRLVSGATTSSDDLQGLAGPLAALDLERAARIATAITRPPDRDRTLSEVAKTAAAREPRAAARLAASIAGAESRASSLAEIAAIVATSDPERAEQIARTITDPYRRTCALMKAAEAFALIDPPRAEEIAVSVADQCAIWPSTEVVKVLAETDLQAAERVARAIPDSRTRATRGSYDRDQALEITATAVAESDPERARQIMQSINDPETKGWAALFVAVACARNNHPDLAEAVAYDIATPYHQSKTLDSLASRFRETAPDRVAHLLADAERIARSITDTGEHDYVIESLASTVAASDSDRAVRIAQSARDPGHKTAAISGIALAVARTSPGNVSRIASLISSPYYRAHALIQAAGAAAHQGHAHEARSLLDEAEPLTTDVSDLDQRASLLTDLAIQLAAYDPGRAARIADEAEVVAKTIPDAPGLYKADPRNHRLENIARRFARAFTPDARTVLRDHAERIARSIPGPCEQADALQAFAEAIFKDDPERAERAAAAVRYPEYRVKALIEVAKLFAPLGPGPE